MVVTPPALPYIKVAMIGNSMQYYNDLPRFLEPYPMGIEQNSCLHGDSNLHSILVTGAACTSSGGLKLESRRKQLVQDIRLWRLHGSTASLWL
jgi:hypothetical protein